MAHIRPWLRRWLPQVKARYCIMVLLLLIVLLALIVWRHYEDGRVPQTLDAAVQACGAAAAAAAALIALGLADPPKKEISIEQFGTAFLQKDEDHDEKGHPTPYVKTSITEKNCWWPSHLFKHYPDRFHSYRVGFYLINTSGFTVKKPRVTITVPAWRMHPYGPEDAPTCNAIFGPTIGPHRPQLTENTYMKTAQLADDWSPEGKRAFWVRMVLDSLPDEPFALDVSVTSDEAEGGICRITIEPKPLIETAAQR